MTQFIKWLLKKVFGLKLNGKPKKSRQRNWTHLEIAYLEENIGKISYRSIGIKLGRSKSSIVNKAVRLGLAPINKK